MLGANCHSSNRLYFIPFLLFFSIFLSNSKSHAVTSCPWGQELKKGWFSNSCVPRPIPKCPAPQKSATGVTKYVFQKATWSCIPMHYTNQCPAGQSYQKPPGSMISVCRPIARPQAQASHAPKRPKAVPHGRRQASPNALAASTDSEEGEPIVVTGRRLPSAVPAECRTAQVERAVQTCTQNKDAAFQQCQQMAQQQEGFANAFGAMNVPVAGNVAQSCAQVVNALAPTRNTVQNLNQNCQTKQAACTSSCEAVTRTLEVTCAQFYGEDEKAAYREQITPAVASCQQMQTQVAQTNNELQRISESLVSAASCVQQVQSLSANNNGGTSTSSAPNVEVPACVTNPNSQACLQNVCTDANFAKTSRVCQCKDNPNSSVCKLSENQQSSVAARPSGAAAGFGLKGSNVDLDLGNSGGLNPADLVNKDGLGAFGNGSNPGGQKGGSPGTLSGGQGGRGGAGDSSGSDAGVEEDKTNILAGWRGASSAMTANTSDGDNGEPSLDSGMGDSLVENTPNMDEFRPDMAYDPKFNRGVAGVAGPDGIRGAYTNIFDNMNEAYRREKYNFIYDAKLLQKK